MPLAILLGVSGVLCAIVGKWRLGWLTLELVNYLASISSPAINMGRVTFYVPNSNYMHCPLWVSAVERSESQVYLYFYSTNNKRADVREHEGLGNFIGYDLMSWPRYLVWDDYQREFVDRAACALSKEVKKVGPIWFSDSLANEGLWLDSVCIDEKIVSVFDVQPVRMSLYRTFAFPHDYITPEVVEQFLWDVFSQFHAEGYKILYKRKRSSNAVHKHFLCAADDMARKFGVLELSPDLSPNRLICRSSVVVSLPFTSTALIASGMGKGSIYYDPTRRLKQDDPAAHGVPLIAGTEVLRQYARSAVL